MNRREFLLGSAAVVTTVAAAGLPAVSKTVVVGVDAATKPDRIAIWLYESTAEGYVSPFYELFLNYKEKQSVLESVDAVIGSIIDKNQRDFLREQNEWLLPAGPWKVEGEDKFYKRIRDGKLFYPNGELVDEHA